MGKLSDVANAGSVLPRFYGYLYGSYDAINYLLGDPGGSALETWLGTQENLDNYNSVMNSPNGPDVVARDSGAMASIANSSTAMSNLVSKRKAMDSMVREQAAIDAFIAVSSAMDTIAASSTAMAAVSSSTKAINGMTGTQTLAEKLANSATAVNALAGNDASFQQFVQNDDAASAVASNSTVMSDLVTNGTGLGILFSRAAAVTAVGTSGTVFDTIDGDDAAMAKLIAGAAGLDPTRVPSNASLFTNIDYRTTVLRVVDSRDILWASQKGSMAFWNANDQGQTFPIYTDGAKYSYVASGSDYIEAILADYNGGKRIESNNTESSDSNTMRELTFSVSVDVTGISTIKYRLRVDGEENSYQNVLAKVFVGASQATYVDANDTDANVYKEYTYDVSNTSGVIPIRFESNLEYNSGASANAQGTIYFGDIRLEA